MSYRRLDSRVHAGRLFDRLRQHFGPSQVFMDVEGGIARGDDFPAVIEAAVASAAAMVVVIGRQWITCTDKDGERRLDKPDDWVRREISVSVKRGIVVLPVLVDGASMPQGDDLPEEIRGLIRRQVSEITDGRWDYDVGEIIKALERVVNPLPRLRSKRRRQWLVGTLAGVACGLLGLLTWPAIVGPQPGDFVFSVDPPEVRIENDPSRLLTVSVRVTNTGKRAAPFRFSAAFATATPPEGAFTLNDNDCTVRSVPPGDSCTAYLTLDPKWMAGDVRAREFDGQLTILSSGGGHSIPLAIVPRVVAATTTTTMPASPPPKRDLVPSTTQPPRLAETVASENATHLEIALSNGKAFTLVAGKITDTKADVIVRFTDARGVGRDLEVDNALRGQAGSSFENRLEQGLASLGGRLGGPRSTFGVALDGAVSGQTVCNTLAPTDKSDPDFTVRVVDAYQACFGLAITGPWLSVAFPALEDAGEVAPAIIESLVSSLLGQNRLRRAFLVLSSGDPNAYRVYAEALRSRPRLRGTGNYRSSGEPR